MTTVETNSARTGDLVQVVGHRGSDAPQSGQIVEILGDPAHPQLRVRWEDDHESLLYPGTDIVVVRPESSLGNI